MTLVVSSLEFRNVRCGADKPWRHCNTSRAGHVVQGETVILDKLFKLSMLGQDDERILKQQVEVRR
jgi:hypothetical protein